MNLKVYEVITQVIGPLPVGMEWVYGLSTIFFIVIILICVIYPFICLARGRW